jgi:uncharacterized protein (TIGR02186 family)
MVGDVGRGKGPEIVQQAGQGVQTDLSKIPVASGLIAGRKKMRLRVFGLLSLAIFAYSLAPSKAEAKVAPLPPSPQRPLVADLSKHLVAITTGFAGTEGLMFGATDGPGDVVLVVRGPTHNEVVRRQAKLAGLIWANHSSVTFTNAPSFMLVASSRPVEDILPMEVQERHQLTPRTLSLSYEGLETDETLSYYAEALIRLKRRDGLYNYKPNAVNLLANRLFRADLFFPSNVPTGTYSAEVYLVRDGQVVSAEITPLIISKVGIGAEVYHFAHDQSALYGLAAILIAVSAGWAAGLAFRKG